MSRYGASSICSEKGCCPILRQSELLQPSRLLLLQPNLRVYQPDHEKLFVVHYTSTTGIELLICVTPRGGGTSLLRFHLLKANQTVSILGKAHTHPHAPLSSVCAISSHLISSPHTNTQLSTQNTRIFFPSPRPLRLQRDHAPTQRPRQIYTSRHSIESWPSGPTFPSNL